jgi:hypothetical protein
MPDLNPIVTEDEIQIFHDAERLGALKKLPEFNRILVVMQQVVDAARADLENNRQPYLVQELTIRWQERKYFHDFITRYIDGVIAKRRQTVRDLFESAGLDEDVIQRNLDASLDFLRPFMEARGNGNK